jgi:hypothetical protein
MRQLQISASQDYFTDGKRPVFLLADTLWFAFSHVTLEEWAYYLDFRQTQGFNAVQIGILPITNDASDGDLGISPFLLNAEGHYDFYRINDEYYDRAEKMVAMAAEKGFTCSMIVLQHNYVAEDWGAAMSPWTVMPFECVNPYVEYVTRKFGKYRPIFIVSGDTTFPTETAKSYYLTALNTIKAIDPGVITTMHSRGDIPLLPEEFLHHENLDFYIYQSSHAFETQDRAYRCAQQYYDCPVKRPIISVEVCYEGHGHADKYGRFTAFDVRKAMWQSVLAGAKAGIGYGAHGVWGWHNKSSKFNNEAYSSIPFAWQTALRFEGAWDAGFVKWIFETYDLFGIEPRDGILNESESKRNEIRMSVSERQDKVVLYVPYSTEIIVDMDLTGYECTLIDLGEKRFAKPVLKGLGGTSVIEMHDFNSDVLIVGVKRE